MRTIRVKKLNENASLPTDGSDEAAGADLYACLDAPVTIAPGESAFITTGLAMEIPRGYAGLIYARSGLACKRGLAPANKVGVVDSDYRGDVGVILINHGSEPFVVEQGDRIAQLVINEIIQGVFVEVNVLTETDRGVGGFGHTGSK